MQFILDKPGADDVWSQLLPHLEAAMSRLGERDRILLALRLYENKTGAEAATLLGIREEAARKRTSRALEKLRRFFVKRGVVSTSSLIVGAIAANSIQVAPVGLAKSVSTAAIAKGSIATASNTTLVKGTMKVMTWLKIKSALGVSMVVLLLGGAASVAISQSAADAGLTVQEIANKSQAAYAALSSYRDRGKVIAKGAGSSTETTFNIRLQRPNLYRIEWTQTGGSYTSKGIVWSDGTGNFFVMGASNHFESAKPEKMQSMQLALASATGVSGSAAADIPGTFFNQRWGDQLKTFVSGASKAKREKDEKIGDTECFVISGTIGTTKLPNEASTFPKTTTRLWIGKRDYLIRKIETTAEGVSMNLKMSDENLKTILKRQDKPVTPEAIAALRNEMNKSMQAAQNGTFVFTQTHENISLNHKFSPSDFEK